jgi:hypothetical protein
LASDLCQEVAVTPLLDIRAVPGKLRPCKEVRGTSLALLFPERFPSLTISS